MKRSVFLMALEIVVSDIRVPTSGKGLLAASFQGQGKRMADKKLNSLFITLLFFKSYHLRCDSNLFLKAQVLVT